MQLEDFSDIRILFVGFTVPMAVTEHICRVDRFMPVQTHKLAWSVVRGLESNGAKVDIVSSDPVASYPSNPRILFNFRAWSRGNDSWNVMMPFINLLVLKHITRFLVSLGLITSWLLRTDGKDKRVILLHGVHSPYLYAALATRIFAKVKIVTIVSDPPGVCLSGEGSITSSLRKLDTYVITRALRCMDGLVVLTSQLAAHFAPKVPSTVVEGILYAEDFPVQDLEEDGSHTSDLTFNVLYAGGLQLEYGVQLLLDAFARTTDPSLRLWILGKGSLADRIQAASNEDYRIVFKGYCPPPEVKELMAKATVLINPRPSNQQFTQFSFPSKTIEYMASGRPVISTRLPGIPEEYFEHLYALEPETPEALAELFMLLISFPIENLNDFGADARRFVFKHKNEDRQGYKILELMKQLFVGSMSEGHKGVVV